MALKRVTLRVDPVRRLGGGKWDPLKEWLKTECDKAHRVHTLEIPHLLCSCLSIPRCTFFFLSIHCCVVVDKTIARSYRANGCKD